MVRLFSPYGVKKPPDSLERYLPVGELLDRQDARQIVPERHQSFQRPRSRQRPPFCEARDLLPKALFFAVRKVFAVRKRCYFAIGKRHVVLFLADIRVRPLHPSLCARRIASQTWRRQSESAAKNIVRHDWTSSAQISLKSAMRKPRKVVLITRGERKNAQVRSERTAPVKEEIRILTCRQTSASMTFHLGPPLLLRHTASNPRAQPGKLLPFPVRTPDSGKK